MSNRINTKATGSRMRESAHLNWMGGPSYDINDPFLRLRISAASCFFGEPQYYHDDSSRSRTRVAKAGSSRGAHYVRQLSSTDLKYLRDTLGAIDPQEWRSLSPRQIMEKTIDECLDKDIERTLQIAVELRNADHMRTTPQVIMVRAAMHKDAKGTGLISQYAPEILKRGDEPATQMAYFFDVYGKGGKRGKVAIPTRLRKAWKKSLEELDDYRLAKYRLETRTVKTIDVVRLVHANSPSIDKLISDELKQTGKTWEAVLSEKGNTVAAWESILPRMPHMAILRNVRNMAEAGLSSTEIIDRLKKGVASGKQLPFRYYSAYKAVKGNRWATPQILDGIEECLEMSIGNVPKFSGRVMSLVDNSGSAWGATTSELGTTAMAEIGNISGVITGKASDEGYVGVFGDNLKVVPVRKTSSIFDQVDNINRIGRGIGGGTEHGIWLFWKQAIENKEHWDHVFVYSDMQAGHGGLYGTTPPRFGGTSYVWRNNGSYIDVPKLIATYRAQVNPNVKVYLVQIAGYEDTLMPEYFKNTYILGGWSGNILRFAAEMSRTFPNQ